MAITCDAAGPREVSKEETRGFIWTQFISAAIREPYLLEGLTGPGWMEIVEMTP
jgi:hypothetical protein